MVPDTMEPRVRLSLRDRQFRAQVLKPIIRAYALVYLSSVIPKLVTFIQRLRNKDASSKEKLQNFGRILAGPVRINSLPTSCGVLVGGSTLLPVLLYRICAWIMARFSKGHIGISQKGDRLIRFITAFFSAWFSFQLLNKNHATARDLRIKRVSSHSEDLSQAPANVYQRPHPVLVGRTMDLTIFTVTRALDVVSCIAWNRWHRRRRAQNRWSFMESVAPGLADAGVFSMSAAIVMWAWFYLPETLPRTYRNWIGGVADVDERLKRALVLARQGNWIYGQDTGQASLLGTMCNDLNLPEEWGDPAKTIPLPCELVHMGCGPSCERAAASRFVRTFKVACATYIPLQVILRLRKIKTPAALIRSISEAGQSSAFLASFVALFYYSVCLARTRLGPKIFDSKTVTPMMWDSGLCIGAGCLMCGWSILVEKARKRQELALFVAPRAVATVLPRLYDKKYQYRERIAFALSAATILTCMCEKNSYMFVRGVFGKIGTSVLNPAT